MLLVALTFVSVLRTRVCCSSDVTFSVAIRLWLAVLLTLTICSVCKAIMVRVFLSYQCDLLLRRDTECCYTLVVNTLARFVEDV